MGDVSYNLSIIKKEQNNTLEDVLNLPLEYAEKFKKKVIVVFDEFQEIEQFSIEKKLEVLSGLIVETYHIFSAAVKKQF